MTDITTIESNNLESEVSIFRHDSQLSRQLGITNGKFPFPQ